MSSVIILPISPFVSTITSNISGMLAGDQKGREKREEERKKRRRKDPKYLFAFIGFWHEMGGGKEGARVRPTTRRDATVVKGCLQRQRSLGATFYGLIVTVATCVTCPLASLRARPPSLPT